MQAPNISEHNLLHVRTAFFMNAFESGYMKEISIKILSGQLYKM